LQHFTQTSEHILFVEKGEGEERARRKEDFATFSANVRHSFLSSLFFFCLSSLLLRLLFLLWMVPGKVFGLAVNASSYLLRFVLGRAKSGTHMRTEWKWNSDGF